MDSSHDSRSAVFRALTRNRNAARVVVGYALFAVCEYGLWIAILVYAYQRGGATAAGLIAVAQLLPAALVALLVAPLADRRSPHAVLLGAYAVQALASALTAAALFTGAPSLFVYVGAVVVSGAMGATRPSQSALLPALATEVDQLTACNVLLGWVENASILLAGLLAGVALTFGEVGHVFAAAAVLLGTAAVLVAPLRQLPAGRRVESAPAPGGTGAATRQLWNDRPTRLLVGLLGAEHLVVGALDLLFVVVAVDVLHAGSGWVGYLNTAYGAGSLVLGAFAALLVGRRLGPVVVASAVLLGAALAACGFVDLLGVVVLLALVGGSRALFDVSVRVLLQRSVTPDRIARVFGFVEGLSMLGLASGSLLVPALVAVGGSRLAIVGTAALLPALVVVRARTVLRIDEHARVPVVEIALLRQLPIFGVLPGAEIEGLAQSLERVRFETGDRLMREGEPGDAYYAIAEGTVDISQQGQHIRALGRADGLGEIALLRSVPRTATAVATTPVTAYRLSRAPFLTAVTGHAPTWESVDHVVRDHEAGDASRRDASRGDASRRRPPEATHPD